MLADIAPYLASFGIIFGLNLLPAFSPPTWAVVAFLSLNFDLQPLPLVPIAAVAATSGRLALALGSRKARGCFSRKRLKALAAARDVLARSPRRLWGTIAFFLISPLPSSQLFVAAGVLKLPVGPLSIAFLVGRLVTYTLYLGGARMARKHFGDVLLETVKSPLGIVLQLVMVVALGLLFAIDWARVLKKAPRPG